MRGGSVKGMSLGRKRRRAVMRQVLDNANGERGGCAGVFVL